MSEKSEAKRDGSRLQKNSGRGKLAKGDAKREHFLVDYKEASKSFTINKSVWGKVCTDTIKVDRDRHPLLKVILGDDMVKVRLAIHEWDVFEEMEEVYNKWMRGELVERGD